MKNIKYIARGFLLLSLLVGGASLASAENNSDINSKNFINAQASLKADALANFDSSAGVFTGANGALRVLNAKVTSVSSSGDISASVPVGNSSLSFVVKADATTKLNGKVLGSAYASTVDDLKAGDKISFAGTITSSTSSSITVDGDNVISRALYAGNVEDKTSFKGEVKAVAVGDNYLTLDLRNGRTVRVNVSSSTVITLDGSAKTLSALEAGDEVVVTGELNSDGTIITASKVTASSDDKDEHKNDDKKDKKGDDRNEHKGFFGKIRSWFWK